MDGWPASWRSLSWWSLAAEGTRTVAAWAWRQIYRHDPTRKYP